MGGRRGRAWIAATLLLTLVVPAATSIAGPKEELEKVQRERAELQDKIDIHEAEASELRANAKALNAQIIDLRDELTRLDADLERISSEVRSVQARIDATQAQIDKIERVATDQAVTLYKAGATDALDALLNTQSLSELDNKIQMLGVAAQKNTDALVRYGRLRVTIEEQHQELFQKQQALQATHDEKSNVLAELDKKHEELSANLAALEEKLGDEHAHEEILASQEQKLRTDILAAQVGRAVAARGISASGFIWPLNGAITSPYGPRWGRMHTGIDIDGVSGDPIVASKAGRVIVASYYGGYGNAIVIDHGGGIATLYGHMSRFAVSNGTSVSQGQVIGYVGCTGSCTGDHLHFEVRVNGSPVNPLDYLP